MHVRALAHDDDAGLDALLAFAGEHGRPRATTAVAYRELVEGDTVAWQGFVVERAGATRAVALATVTPAIGLDQVQLNAFGVPDDQAAFDAVLDAVDAWGRARGASHVTAHVSAPTGEQLASWRAARYEQVGERTRVVRDVTDEDAELETPVLEGASITSLAERPELEESAEALWRIAHDDVPSALRFDSADLPPLRREVGIADGEQYPWTVLVAVDDADEVVGLAVGFARYADRPTVIGHRMTATARAWRGRGVAFALKVELIRRAARHGVTMLEASNDSGNAPMQAINARLGYRTDYRLVLLRRAIGS